MNKDFIEEVNKLATKDTANNLWELYKLMCEWSSNPMDVGNKSASDFIVWIDKFVKAKENERNSICTTQN